MSEDQNSPYANSHNDDHHDSRSGREGYERDALYRDSAWDNPDSHYGYGQVRGWTWFSWFAILSVVTFVVVLRQLDGPHVPDLPPLDDSPASMHGLQEFQGRAIVGMGEMLRQLPGANPDQIKQLVEGDDPAQKHEHLMAYAKGNFGQRLQNIVVVGDVSGPENAMTLLTSMNLQLKQEQLVLSAEQQALQRSLGKLYLDFQRQKFDAPSLKDEERQRILAKLGWHGSLALTPPQAPDQVAREAVLHGPLQFCVAIFVAFGTVCVLGVLGLLGYLIFGVSALSGSLKFGLRPGTSASGVYAETFAIWLFGFVGSQLAMKSWPFPQTQLALLLVIMFGSLLVLFWPVVRGIPFRQVRQDLGLTWGRAGIGEPLMGLPGYSLMLPMLCVGVVLMLGIVMVSAAAQPVKPPGQESAFQAVQLVPHPAVVEFLQGDRWVQLQLMLLACVAAPIVEEIMFRGVLYRHLRDASRRWGWLFSGVFSALWMSFLFAVIHPQPPFAIPALMGIACGCTFVREWRDSLWASMAVHALNNGLVFAILWMGSL
ncbi:MAG: putative rane-associated, metal-dependent hydrolase [Planctomycetaceae bacterium]|nr:putative rane-associated, metal-dependent hydrolase [Planctomycetaceae bacterium]